MKEREVIDQMEVWYQEGIVAREKGQFSECPYDLYSIKAFMWNKGYRLKDLSFRLSYAQLTLEKLQNSGFRNKDVY